MTGMYATSDPDDWHALLTWAEEVAKQTRDYYRTHAYSLTEADAIRGKELIARAMAALDARDAPAFRAAVTAYGAQCEAP